MRRHDACCRYKVAYKKRHVRSHDTKSNSALLQDFLARRSSATTPTDSKPGHQSTPRGTREKAPETNCCKAAARGSHSPGWLSAVKHQQGDYTTIVNSLSTESCRQVKGQAQQYYHNVGNEPLDNERNGSNKALPFNRYENSKPLIGSNGGIVNGPNSSSAGNDGNVSQLQDCKYDSNLSKALFNGQSCSNGNSLVSSDCVPDTPKHNRVLDSELIPPPLFFNTQMPIYARKLTTTV